MQCFTLIVTTALKKVFLPTSNRSIYYEMIENKTIAASSK